MAHKLWKTCLIAGGAAAALWGVTRVVRQGLAEEAVAREEPGIWKWMKPLFKGKKTDAFSEERDYFSEKLAGLPIENVEIEGFDRTRLVGHWYPAENAKRVMIAMHGWRSDWRHDFGAIAEFWHENGCSILFAEQRGQGKSGGAGIGFGAVERHDCPAWAGWVNRATDGKYPIYLAGVSMGATTVLMASELHLADNVCGIIADCGFTSADAIWKHVTEKNMHFPYALQRSALHRVYKEKMHISPDAVKTTDCLRRCRVPVFFIHGTADSFVPIGMTYENYEACASQKKLFVVENAGHGMSYLRDPSGYMAATTDFWAQCEGKNDFLDENSCKNFKIGYNKEDGDQK